jgi:hypothetical protein
MPILTAWKSNKPILCAVVALLAISFASVGCGDSQPIAKLAPEKPLSQAEEGLLKQIETTSKEDRPTFMLKHRTEVMTFASGNSAFGKRLNSIMGVKSGGTK